MKKTPGSRAFHFALCIVWVGASSAIFFPAVFKVEGCVNTLQDSPISSWGLMVMGAMVLIGLGGAIVTFWTAISDGGE